MKKEIRLKYKWIRQRRKEVLLFLRENYWINKNTSSKSSLQKDLGITGDDAYEMLIKFEQEFHVDFSKIKFDDHFDEEGNDPIPLFLVMLLVKLLLIPFAMLSLFISLSAFKEIIDYIFFETIKTAPKKPFTVGDLITCSFTHSYTLQKEVSIKLI